jgi:type IV secretion system protein VirB6/type IV secretion system protein TrbL
MVNNMRVGISKNTRFLKIALLLGVILILYSVECNALDSNGILDDILNKYKDNSKGWAATITTHASWLFWTLVTISMVWTFGFMMFQKADIGEFFAEFIKFTIFTGFYWWLLINGPIFAGTIINSMLQMGVESAGLDNALLHNPLSPSSIVDIGFGTLDKAINGSAILKPVDSAVGIVVALVILIIIALIAVNMLVLLISAWILAYAGIFYLGFGGSRWTSEIAIHYYKSVLGIAMQLFAMVLIIGIGQSFLNGYYAKIGTGLVIRDYAVMLVAAIVLLVLTDKIPPMLSGVMHGSGIGHIGGGLGAGAAMGAASMAAGMAISSARESVGGAQAVMAAYKSAQEHVSSGTDAVSNAAGSAANLGVGGSGGSGGAMESLSSKMGIAASVAMGTAGTLIKGGFSTANDAIKDSTVGGSIAKNIQQSDETAKAAAQGEGGKPTFGNDSIGAGKQDSFPLTGNDEIDAFTNKNT